MFQTEESIISDSLAILEVGANYKIQPGDVFTLQVSGNNGEMIIDPDNLLKQELGMGNIRNQQAPVQYIIQDDGNVKIPVIKEIKLSGKTINEANEFIAKGYNKYYPNSFVNINILNRRIMVFSPSGSKIINLENEGMNVLEALALSNAITDKSYADKIRLIRGDLKHPNVQIIDLTTIAGMKKANLALLPNDILYIEPKKVLGGQALRENILPYVAVLTSVTNAVLLYLTLTRQ